MNCRVATSDRGTPSLRIATSSVRNGVTLTRTRIARNARLFLATIVRATGREPELAALRVRRSDHQRQEADQDQEAEPARQQVARRDAREADDERQRQPRPQRAVPPAERRGDDGDDEGERATSLIRASSRWSGPSAFAVAFQELKPHPGRPLRGRVAGEDPCQAQPDPEDDQRPDQPRHRRGEP